MVNKIIKDLREFSCQRCGGVWITTLKKKKNPIKCPRCQAQLKKFPPKIKITRIETTKKVLTF